VRRMAVTIAASLMLTATAVVAARGQGPAGGAGADVKKVLYNVADTMGMLRTGNEVDRIATIRYWATGTMTAQGKPCKLKEYAASVNYLHKGMRVDFTCEGGQRQVQVVNGQYAWNETEPGKNATPTNAAAAERQLQIWMLPEGAVKAAMAAGANAKVTMEDGATVLSFPLPAPLTGTMRVFLNAKNFIDKVEARMGNTVYENTYSEYGDYNGDDYLSDVLFPRRITQKQGTATLLNLTLTKTNTYNPYVIMPVPENVDKAKP